MFCFCADPCTHSVQDLNRLTYFRNFWNHGIWRFFFVVVNEDLVFVILLLEGGLGMAFYGYCLLSCHSLSPLLVLCKCRLGT